MKRIACILLAAVMLLGMAACAHTKGDWQEQYDLGMRYLNEGNYEEAILAFSAAIEIDDSRPEAYMGRAEAYEGLGDHDKALRDYKRAQKIARENDDEDLVEDLEEIIENLEEIIDEPDETVDDPDADVPTEEETTVMDKEAAIPALNALLSGVDYDTPVSLVQEWSEDVLTGTIFTKLLYDDLWGGDSTYFQQLGLVHTDGEDGYLHYDIKKIQELTHDAYGRAFPENVAKPYMQVSGNELLVTPAAGDGITQFLVQDVTGADGMVTAVGIAVVRMHAWTEFLGYFRATFRENPNSIYGYTLVTFEKTAETQAFDNLVASASSELQESGYTHFASYVLDGKLDTAWCEGVSGVGVQEWIRLERADGSKMEIGAIEFALGYQKSDRILGRNGWPYRILIECEGYRQEAVFVEYTDVVVLERPVETAWIKITILEAAAGTHYEDTCITEIRLRGIGCTEETPKPLDGVCEQYKNFFYANYSDSDIVCLADVTHDGTEEMLVVHFSDEYHSEVYGRVYTLKNGVVTEIFSNRGSDYHAGGGYSWYLVPVPGTEYCNLAWETHSMWQGMGQITYSEYLLTESGEVVEVAWEELDSTKEGNHDENGFVTDAAYNAYIAALNAELADCYILYCAFSNGSGAKELNTSPASVFGE